MDTGTLICGIFIGIAVVVIVLGMLRRSGGGPKVSVRPGEPAKPAAKPPLEKHAKAAAPAPTTAPKASKSAKATKTVAPADRRDEKTAKAERAGKTPKAAEPPPAKHTKHAAEAPPAKRGTGDAAAAPPRKKPKRHHIPEAPEGVRKASKRSDTHLPE